MTLEKRKNGYLLYLVVDEIKINIDGWSKNRLYGRIKTNPEQQEYYQWIGINQIG